MQILTCMMHGLQGYFTMEEESWKGVSPAAKELVASLLAVDSLRRPSATEVCVVPLVYLNHAITDEHYVQLL